MPFLRRHSNGFQVVIDHHPEGWAIYSLANEEILGTHGTDTLRGEGHR